MRKLNDPHWRNDQLVVFAQVTFKLIELVTEATKMISSLAPAAAHYRPRRLDTEPIGEALQIHQRKSSTEPPDASLPKSWNLPLSKIGTCCQSSLRRTFGKANDEGCKTTVTKCWC